MVPSGYSPTPAQARALLAFLPQLVAARHAPLYERASLARRFMDALHDAGFVVAEDFLPWATAWPWFADDPARAAAADLAPIQLTFTHEALADFGIEGRFVEFAFGPVAEALLRRVAVLYGVPMEALSGEGAASRDAAVAPPALPPHAAVRSVPWVPRRPQ